MADENFMVQEDQQEGLPKKRKQDPPLAIRTSPEEQKRFRDLCSELNLGQGEMLKELLSAYEVNRIATAKPGIETMIRNLQAYTTSINTTVVQIADTLTAEAQRVVDDTRAKIDDMAAKLARMRDDLDDERTVRKRVEAESSAQISSLQADITKQLGEIADLEKQLSEAKYTCQLQRDRIATADIKAADAQEEAAHARADAQSQIESAKKKVEQAQREAQQQRAAANAAIESESKIRQELEEYKTKLAHAEEKIADKDQMVAVLQKTLAAINTQAPEATQSDGVNNPTQRGAGGGSKRSPQK